ncbi:MAG: LysR family transcriptional regulator, partial [Pyrinomonadaceae bacterium]
MEMTQLEFFLKVAEEGSFSKAADTVGRTQPAVSIAIRRLEEEIGAPLFDRSQKTPTLTEAGEVIHVYARRFLALRDQARGSVAELRSLQRGRVRIGANESTSLYLLPQVILAYRESHPDIKVEIYRHVSERLPREVLERNVDFAVLAFEPIDRDLESFCVLKDELVLILHPEHRLARRGSVTVGDLGAESFLAHNVKTASRNKVVEVFAEHHTPLNITLELATVETIKRFVQLKIGLAFVPRMCVSEELERGTLATVPVEGLIYHRTLWVTHRRHMTFSHAAAAFLRVLRQHANVQKPEGKGRKAEARGRKAKGRKAEGHRG